MITKIVHEIIEDVMEKYGFTGDIIINTLYEKNIKSKSYIGIYYFVYEDEMYHIIAVYTDNKFYISLNNEIAKAIA